MSVINFCNALTSYPSEYNIDITVRNLAQLFECPNWIVSCRHMLSHPTANLPTLGILGEAIAFALDWMDRFFWSKAISGQFNFSTSTGGGGNSPQRNKQHTNQASKSSKSAKSPQHQQQQTLSLGPPKSVVSKEQAHHETCLLLFTTCQNKRVQIKQNISQFIQQNPNQYIRTFCEILVFGVPIHEKLSTTGSFSLPQLLLRRSARIFALIFSALPADQMLILLLNQLLDQIVLTEQMCAQHDAHQEYHQRAHHSGMCWLWAIVKAVTIPMMTSPVTSAAALNDTVTSDQFDISTEEVRRTIFQKSFDLFGDLSALKRRHTFTWVRMFYRICKLNPNQNTSRLISRFYHLIDRDIVPEDKFDLIDNMVNICSIEQNSATGVLSKDANSGQVKTLSDLKRTIALGSTDKTATSKVPDCWHIPIGASLNSSLRLSSEVQSNENEPEGVDNQQKYLVDDDDACESEASQTKTENHRKQPQSSNFGEVEMITID